ncbi:MULTISPECIES: DUF4349 domain-containing protein [unclassified Streptomyces]|uniref:DUF4349 domain-containing protein n=1 Tax=unclassified Streptomyces TaxID=2593676 RepID=UPI00381C71B7
MNAPTTAVRRALAAVALAGVLVLTGCSASDGGSLQSSADDKSVAEPAQGPAPEAGPVKQDSDAAGVPESKSKVPPVLDRSLIVRTATLTVEAGNVPDALARSRTLVEAAGGYIGDESTSLDDEGHEHSRVTLRVPPTDYERVLGDLAGLGRLLERKVSAQDVTSQVVDVESRIKTQRASVARVRELMDRATKLSDVVTLEGELSSRQADLEALEAQQASLKERTGMATVTLVLTEPDRVAAPAKADGFWASVGDALGAGWHALYVTLRALLIALAAALPFAVLALLGLLAFRLLRRRRDPVAPAPVTEPAAVEQPRP